MVFNDKMIIQAFAWTHWGKLQRPQSDEPVSRLRSEHVLMLLQICSILRIDYNFNDNRVPTYSGIVILSTCPFVRLSKQQWTHFASPWYKKLENTYLWKYTVMTKYVERENQEWRKIWFASRALTVQHSSGRTWRFNTVNTKACYQVWWTETENLTLHKLCHWKSTHNTTLDAPQQ